MKDNRLKAFIGILTTSLLLCSCAAINVDPARIEGHVIAIDALGDLIDPLSREPIPDPPGFVRAILNRADAGMDELNIDANHADPCPCPPGSHPEDKGSYKVRRLLLSVHGGLNTARDSLGNASVTLDGMKRETNPVDKHYPIFFTWPTGPLDTYGEHLFTLRQGERQNTRGMFTWPVIFVVDILKGLVDAPRSWIVTGFHDVGVGAKVGFDWDLLPSWKNADALYQTIQQRPPDQRPYQVELGDYRRGWLEQTRRLGAYLLTLPSKIVTQSVVLDGMGQGAWESMLHRTYNVFRSPEEFDLGPIRDRPELVAASLERKASGAAALFLRCLQEHIDNERMNRNVCYQITLVGHSMGAIVLNEALRVHQKLPITRIVYMGAASSIRQTENSVVPFLKQNKNAKFHNLTLHPVAEVDETNTLDLVPRGSLLVWIDGWYTTPTNHTERRLGIWVNAIQALHVFESVRGQVTMKGFGVRPDSKPQKHGDFNDCPYWKRDFWNPDGQMYY